MKAKINFGTLAVCITVLAAAALMSFRPEGGNKVALIKVYQSGIDFNNAITVSYPGGVVEKFTLLPNKEKNYEANDKQIQKSLNTLTALGYKLVDVSATSSADFLMTQYIFQE